MKKAIIVVARLSIMLIPKVGFVSQYLFEWCAQREIGYGAIVIEPGDGDYFRVTVCNTKESEFDECVAYVNNRIEAAEKQLATIKEH